MNVAVLRRQLIDLRWHIFWYGIGIAVYAASMVLLFPAFEGVFEEAQYPEEFLEFFGAAGDLGDPRYFLQAEYFSFVPLILPIYAIMVGTGLFAGDEGRGTLETMLAQPLSRGTLFRSRVVALLLGLVVICALNIIGWVVTVPFVDLHGLGLGTLVKASFAMIPLTSAVAGISILLAAIAPNRGTAGGLMAVVVIAAYLIASFANTVEAIHWASWITPYFYADMDRVLTEGLVWWHQLLLAVLAVVSFILGWAAFNAREIGAGTWQPRALARGWGMAG